MLTHEELISYRVAFQGAYLPLWQFDLMMDEIERLQKCYEITNQSWIQMTISLQKAEECIDKFRKESERIYNEHSHPAIIGINMKLQRILSDYDKIK